MSKEIGPAPKIFRTPAVQRITRDEQGRDKDEFKKELQERAGEEGQPSDEHREKAPEPLLEDDDTEQEPGEAAPGVGQNLDIST